MDKDLLNDMNVKLDVLISLLARQYIGETELTQIITLRKRNPDKYVKGYNALDGTRSVSEVATIIGVAIGTLSPILQEWLVQGLIYEAQRSGGVFYKHLFKIHQDSKPQGG